MLRYKAERINTYIQRWIQNFISEEGLAYGAGSFPAIALEPPLAMY